LWKTNVNTPKFVDSECHLLVCRWILPKNVTKYICLLYAYTHRRNGTCSQDICTKRHYCLQQPALPTIIQEGRRVNVLWGDDIGLGAGTEALLATSSAVSSGRSAPAVAGAAVTERSSGASEALATRAGSISGSLLGWGGSS
jgi:hypothetical protein